MIHPCLRLPSIPSAWHRRAALLVVAAIGAPLLPAQGLRWTDPNVQPALHVRENADRSWTLCVDGWSMVAGGPLNAANEAAVVGVDAGARTVHTSPPDVLNGGGGAIASAPLFPFAADTRVPAIFESRMPNLDRFGFLAPITGSVPEAGLASIRFRIDLLQPMPASVLVPMFASVRVGVAATDDHANPTGHIFVVSPERVQLARVLYYVFDRGSGTEEINLAGIDGGAPSRATLQRSSGTPWIAGRFGSGLRAGTTVDTGFTGDLGVRFTVAWFMRGSTAPAGVSPIFTLGNWRMFTGGAAGTGLRCMGSGVMTNLELTDDVQGLAASGWVHVALVVDGDRGRATWFVNGQSRNTITLSAPASIPPNATTMTVGSSQTFANVYDLDEFRLSASAESAATIAQWAAGSSPAAVAFTEPCGANLRCRGTPSPGQELQYRVEATPGSGVLLTIGAGARLGGAALPLDLGLFDPALAGCAWYSDMALSLPAATIPAAGFLPLPLSLPNQSWLIGVEIYAQAIVVAAGGLKITNAHLISIR